MAKPNLISKIDVRESAAGSSNQGFHVKIGSAANNDIYTDISTNFQQIQNLIDNCDNRK